MTNIDSHVRSRFSKTLSIPSALNGRAFIDIAKSGSGKVNAFIWSAIVHMMTQIKHQVDDITIVLICAPQRELAEQLHLEYKQYEKPRNINSVGAFDSGNMHEQIMSCHKECEILVCAPTIILGPMTDWRGDFTASSIVASTNRISTMTAIFQSQSQLNFVASTDTSLKSQSVAVGSSVTQKCTGQISKTNSISTTK
ncbi:unnamed protein product [Rotaria sp. Silwood1]|nr:unnamed protein product [Rotaria sp. Silwood1]CAF3411300.1 unnamed protein product [Rotaria sp. Silwood1]